MGMLSSFLHPDRPFRKAQEQLDKYYGQAQAYAQPFVTQGQSAYAPLSGAMNKLLDPMALQNEWAQGYESSPYADQMIDMATQHGLNAASSMGLMGSSPALQAIQAGTSQISAADRDNYMNNLMQKYLSGAQLAQGLYGTGVQMGSQMGQNAMNMGQNSADMAYGASSAPGNMLGGILGMGAGLAGSALGGPIGGAIANRWIGPWMTGGK